MTRFIHGKMHGRTIELSEDPGLAEGQPVEISIRVVPKRTVPWCDGLKRCAGILADDWTEEDDRILQEIHEDRKRSSRREIPE